MNNNIAQQTPVNNTYQTFGKKVFWLFFLRISPISLVLLVLSIILLIISFQPFLISTTLGNLQTDVLWAALIAFTLFLITAATSFAYAWMIYINYVFSMADDSFKIKRGFLNKTENAIPYRQIQNVDIERSFTFQMLGLSRLIILTAGQEDKHSNDEESEGIIPAIDQKLAEWLQTELLKRANIQKVIETK